jgi:hypothetical protein
VLKPTTDLTSYKNLISYRIRKLDTRRSKKGASLLRTIGFTNQSTETKRRRLLDSLTELFCLIDDFCQGFEPKWEKGLLTDGQKKRRRLASLSLSELMTPAVPFYQLRYRQFKRFFP